MIQEMKNEALGESYFSIRHATGLTVLVYPKKGYSTTYGIIGTNYGSIDNLLSGKTIPNGTAHFLEHKLFESEELDAFDRFAVTGASANAYTSFDRTCYLFSCADHAMENLQILLDFVRHPYFTEQTVRKEQGIIGQEIRMYLDEPGWRVLFNLLECLYHNHPVKIDIAGTEDSIAQISADLLYQCYEQYYNPENMVLAVVGDVTVEGVLSICDTVLGTAPAGGGPNRRPAFREPDSIVRPYAEQEFAVTMPSFALGFKEPAGPELPSLKDRILTGLLLDYLAGETSPLYNRLLEDGFINGSFGYEYFVGPGYRTVLFSGMSRYPEQVADAIKTEIERLRKDGLDETEFQMLRKMNYGRSVMDYNETDGLANELISACLEGYHLFDELDVYRTVTKEDAEDRLQKILQADHSALSVILPKKDG